MYTATVDGLTLASAQALSKYGDAVAPIAMYITSSQIVGPTEAVSIERIEPIPNGTQINDAKINIHIIERKAPLRVIVSFEVATYMP
jgi:hypothetical protein